MPFHPLAILKQVVGVGPFRRAGLVSKAHVHTVGPGVVIGEARSVRQQGRRVGGIFPIPTGSGQLCLTAVNGQRDSRRRLGQARPSSGIRRQPQADAHSGNRQNDCRKDGRPAVGQGPLHPAGHVVLSESGGQAAGLGGGQGQQGPGVAGVLPFRQISQHPLVAGGLQIPAEQPPGQPQHRVEPVDRRRQEEEGFPHKIPPAQVEPLMGEDIAPVGRLQPPGQVDFGREKAQDEGRTGLVALQHPGRHPHRRLHPLFQLPVGIQPPAPQYSHPQQPQKGERQHGGNPGFRHLRRLHGCKLHHGVLRQGLRWGDTWDARRTRLLYRLPGGLHLGRGGQRFFHQGGGSPGAGEADGAHHAEEHHHPQQQPHKGRGPQPHQRPPQNQHHQGGKSGGKAHAPYRCQQLSHGAPHSRQSAAAALPPPGGRAFCR